jgi:drug/metabolite transporter (DMT)-like permease
MRNALHSVSLCLARPPAAMTTVSAPRRSLASVAIGTLFVLLWSTGFIGAKLGLPYAEPLTFLVARMAFVAALLLVVALISGAPWPNGGRTWMNAAIAGLLIHGGYLGGVFSAIHQGLSAGIAALIVGLQPLLTALAAIALFGEKASRRQWTGLVLGLMGVALVVSGNVQSGGLNGFGVVLATFALLSITAGTLYQKRFGAGIDFRTAGVIQYSVTGLALLPLAALTESMHIVWSGEFVFALTWLVLVLSVGAVSLLYFLIKHGRATEVSSLFYLTPPTTAVMAYLLFGETLTHTAVVGMVVAIVGVALVITK